MFRSTNIFLANVIENTKILDRINDSRYVVRCLQKDGFLSEIYFSVPIYSTITNNIVQASFIESGAEWRHFGSNSIVSCKNDLLCLKTDEISAVVTLPDKLIHGNDENILYHNAMLSPTLNGVLFDVKAHTYTFKICASSPFDLRINDRSLVLLIKDKPMLTLSCMGAYSLDETFLNIANINFKRKSPHTVEVTVSSGNLCSAHFGFEINLFEEKLFQDTTVESKNVTLNNAYGSVAAVGYSYEYGEQWLYSKMNLNKLVFAEDKKIHSVGVYYPRHSCLGSKYTAHKLKNSFCSLGAIWDNKVTTSNCQVPITELMDFYCMDITELIQNSKHLSEFAYVIRSEERMTPISTGDSYAFPPFLVIKYKQGRVT